MPTFIKGFPKGSSDCYVTKRKQLTGEVIWTTQFGSSSDDRAAATAVDAEGNIIVAGGSTGALFDQQGGGGYWDIFLAKLKGEDGAYVWKKQVSVEGVELLDAAHVLVTVALTSCDNATDLASPFRSELCPRHCCGSQEQSHLHRRRVLHC